MSAALSGSSRYFCTGISDFVSMSKFLQFEAHSQLRASTQIPVVRLPQKGYVTVRRDAAIAPFDTVRYDEAGLACPRLAHLFCDETQYPIDFAMT